MFNFYYLCTDERFKYNKRKNKGVWTEEEVVSGKV